MNQFSMKINQHIKTQSEKHPNGSPDAGFLKPNNMTFIPGFKNPKVYHQHSDNKNKKNGEKPEFVKIH